ncbi:hypothetical protein COLO4_14906 [Corchorus olitorius]|uniref:LRAT domain-containing protein n=1 Tax=Corchorus olitorius TaxID=93759 RepID=A0A1R3JQ71_9ROSI|nr:hypothetical protein COLO4_14906 [Corchorus olitorius]
MNSFGKYNAFFRNCEDFATYCKCCKAASNQVAKAVYGFSLSGIVAYSIAKENFRKKENDNLINI